MDKPKKVTPFAISKVFESARDIYFSTDATIANSLKEFGHLVTWPDGSYRLTVDPRYVFGEVVAYLKSLDTSLGSTWSDALNSVE